MACGPQLDPELFGEIYIPFKPGAHHKSSRGGEIAEWHISGRNAGIMRLVAAQRSDFTFHGARALDGARND